MVKPNEELPPPPKGFRYQGVLIYKCRTCGIAYDAADVPQLGRALVLINASGSFQADEQTMRRTIVHGCGGGLYGIADLIGGRSSPAASE